MPEDKAGWINDILAQLDSDFAECMIPGAANANYLGARCQALGFIGDDEWLLAFQELRYGRPTGMYAVDLTAYGNRLPERHFGHVEVITGPDGASGWNHELRDWLNDLHDVHLEVHGAPLRQRFTWDDYRTAGISPDDIDWTDQPSTEPITGLMQPEAAFLRMLAHHLGDELLLLPAAILTELRRPDLRLVFTLGEWRNPDPTEDEVASDSTSYWAMAASLAAGRPVGLAVCSRNPNTHWSNWHQYE